MLKLTTTKPKKESSTKNEEWRILSSNDQGTRHTGTTGTVTMKRGAIIAIGMASFTPLATAAMFVVVWADRLSA